jgi:hypothetical protein
LPFCVSSYCTPSNLIIGSAPEYLATERQVRPWWSRFRQESHPGARHVPPAGSTPPSSTSIPSSDKAATATGDDVGNDDDDDDDEDLRLARSIKFNGFDAIECTGAQHNDAHFSSSTGRWCYPRVCTCCQKPQSFCDQCLVMASCWFCLMDPKRSEMASMLCSSCRHKCDFCKTHPQTWLRGRTMCTTCSRPCPKCHAADRYCTDCHKLDKTGIPCGVCPRPSWLSST